MKFCQQHWDRLRAVVKEKGMEPLIAKSAEAAMERMQEEAAGTQTPATFDPLMSCHWMIANNALQAGGLYLMTGDFCPLCELVKNTKIGMDEQWIESATEAALAYCREHKLLPGVQ